MPNPTPAAVPSLRPLVDAFNQILDHPETWDQSSWHCGAKHCLFGWFQIKAGLPENATTCEADVTRVTGISESEALWLSGGSRTLTDMHSFITTKLKGEEFFRAGYDRAGYDRAGYDRAGYNRAGKRLERIVFPEPAPSGGAQ